MKRVSGRVPEAGSRPDAAAREAFPHPSFIEVESRAWRVERRRRSSFRHSPLLHSPFHPGEAAQNQRSASVGCTRAEFRLGRPVPTARRAFAGRGAFMVVVMICLLISTLLVGALLKLALLQSRQLSQESANLQVHWLAESGLERAASRLAADSEYSGETWTIDREKLGGRDAGVVTIHVRKDPSQILNRAVTIEADYPAEGPHRVHHKLVATVAVTQES